MTARLAAAYGATLVAFVLIDLPYLTWAGVPMFRDALGEMLLVEPRLGAAALFYLAFPAGIVHFAVRPALAAGSLVPAAVNGAAFGFFAYMTYELTNHATLKAWTWNLVIADTAWGTALTAAAAVIGTLAARRFASPPVVPAA